MTVSHGCLALAVAATATAICMSVLAGWQRGGELPERLVWVAVGIVLVVGAHLLRTLCRTSPLVRRSRRLSALGCVYGNRVLRSRDVLRALAAACRRTSRIVSPGGLYPVPIGRSLTMIMTDRATHHDEAIGGR